MMVIEKGATVLRLFAVLTIALSAAAYSQPTLPGRGHHGQPPYYRPWLERVQGWEQVIPELRDFGMLLVNLELTPAQVADLERISEETEEQLEELREEYDLHGGRRAVFEAFTDDMYMSASVDMAIWDRQWFQQDATDLITGAMGEIHELLSEEQLELARAIIDDLPQLGPPPGEPWPVMPERGGTKWGR